MVGTKLERFIPDEDLRLKLFDRENQLVEGVLHHRDLPIGLRSRKALLTTHILQNGFSEIRDPRRTINDLRAHMPREENA